jgi:hypothetical protein
MNFLRLIRHNPNEVVLTDDDFDFAPMTELETFAARTREIVGGLDSQIADLDAEINAKIARLGDLRRIRASQDLALRYMEDGI